MNNKLLSIFIIIVLFIGIFTVFITVVKAENLNLFCSKKQMTVILKNEANIDIAKEKILKIPQLKIIKIKYRDKEWSHMVDKIDLLPNMENPFKNEFVIKINKKANIEEIYNKIKKMDFVEDVKYSSDNECVVKQK